jgi:hypothetical protein
MSTHTADSIKTAAKAYNSDYPEAAAEIDAGVAILLINARYADNYGHRISVVIDYGVRAQDGGWIGADMIELRTYRSLDGRVGPDDQARRRLARLIREAEVPVEIRRVR